MHHPIAEIVQFGETSAAFDTRNSPLFYELRLKYSANPVVGAGDGDAFADPITALNGILPDGLIIPVTGDASAYVSRPGDGAISSLWTVNGASAPAYRFVTTKGRSQGPRTSSNKWCRAALSWKECLSIGKPHLPVPLRGIIDAGGIPA